MRSYDESNVARQVKDHSFKVNKSVKFSRISTNEVSSVKGGRT